MLGWKLKQKYSKHVLSFKHPSHWMKRNLKLKDMNVHHTTLSFMDFSRTAQSATVEISQDFCESVCRCLSSKLESGTSPDYMAPIDLWQILPNFLVWQPSIRGKVKQILAN